MKKIELQKIIASDDQHILKKETESKIGYDLKRFKCWVSLLINFNN